MARQPKAEKVVENKQSETTKLVSSNKFLYIAPYNVQFVNGEYDAPNDLVDKLLQYCDVSVK